MKKVCKEQKLDFELVFELSLGYYWILIFDQFYVILGSGL